MAAVESKMLELGTIAPKFELLDTVSDKVVSFDDIKSSKATVVMFICNHCPFVININKALSEFGKDYIPKGISVIAISSNDVENYPEDSPEKMKINAETQNWNFPYLYDKTQEVAKSYHAVCTPDIYLFDGNDKLVYRGQFDDSRPNNGIIPTGKDLRAAINSLLNGTEISNNQIPSIGCNIKWKS
ncbi:thioredoxin family protein [Candidatus Kapabacteria bacterium]|nr:thioredoxin family protein [Candidatus Kapabacteria bacterium]